MPRALICLFALVLTGCPAHNGSFTRSGDGGCLEPDHVTHVSGGRNCLAIETVVAPPGGTASVLLAMVHGDGTHGQWARQVRKWMGAGLVFAPDVAVVDIARPGYAIVSGTSSGVRTGNSDSYTPENIAAVMTAIASLKRHYGAERVVTLSRSGGSAIVAAGLGLHPDQAPDEAILVACPCDTDRWLDMRGARNQRPSHSPIRQIASIPARTRIIAITGSKDDNTFPVLAQSYVQSAERRGLRAQFVLADGFNHFSSSGAPQVLEHLNRAIAAR
jgi:hypothetical protein